MRGGALDITLVNNNFENFLFQNLLDLFFDTELADATAFLFTVLTLNFLFSGQSFRIASLLLMVVNFLSVVLLLFTHARFNKLMSVLLNLIILGHEHIDFFE